MLCDNIDGWDGVEGGKEVQEGGAICIPVSESYLYTCFCGRNQHSIVKQLFSN